MSIQATWWVQATPGTTFWRCIIPSRHLRGQALRLTEDDLVLDENEEPFMPRQKGHASIWQFPGNATRALMMAHCQDMGIKTLVEVDDNYLHPPPHVTKTKYPWLRKAARDGTDFHSHEAHRKIAQWADGIIVSTEPLARAYENINDDIFICPNSIDLQDWEEPSWIDDGKVRIGYAGSDSHFHDLSLVERGLHHAAVQEGVEVWKLGVHGREFSFPYQKMPWTDSLEEYRVNLRVLDVGLCPLKRSPWHDCKSDIKAMEYTMAGALPIVQSDTPVFKDWIDVVPSAATEKEWLKRIKDVLKIGPEGRRKLWQDAYDFVLQNKLIEHHIHKWREAIS